METAFLYRRLSQDEKEGRQGEDSLNNQLRDMQTYCNKHNILILKDYNEGIHTADEYRQVFDKMIKEAFIIKPTHIIVREQSRFSRDVALTMQTIKTLDTYGIKVHSLFEGNLNRDITMTGFKAVSDQYLIIKGREHQRLMMDRKKEDKTVFGRPPFGYKAQNKTWVIDPEKAIIVKNIFNMYVVENLKIKEIAQKVNIPAISVYFMLKNTSYCGYFTSSKKFYGKDPATGKKKVMREEKCQYKLQGVEPLINEELFTKATKKMYGNTRWRIK